MVKVQNYYDLSKEPTEGSISEPGVQFCTHTCVLPTDRTHVAPMYMFGVAGHSAKRHNKKTRHPNCTPDCPAHPSHPVPLWDPKATYEQWMALSEQARIWARHYHRAKTPDHDVSDQPVAPAAGGSTVASGSGLATGNLGESTLWAWPDDAFHPNMFSGSQSSTVQPITVPAPSFVLPSNTGTVPSSSSSSRFPRQVRSSCHSSYFYVRSNSNSQHVTSRSARKAPVRAHCCSVVRLTDPC